MRKKGDIRPMTRVRWVASLGMAAGFIAACNRPTDPTLTAPLAQVASIHLYDTHDQSDLTRHVPLYAGYTTKIGLLLYVASGRQITHLADTVLLDFTFAPSSLATATTVDSVRLVEAVTPTAAAGVGGSLTVKLTAPSSATTKSFGPFPVLIH